MNMSNRKLTSEKVLKAMTLNQKEDRVLAKTFGTLDLEKKFSRNVLDLHLRTEKSKYRHLKEKVSKIKSNLDPDEITMLKQMEMEGKLKPPNTFNLNAAMKIAAAARRLKLYPENMKRAKSASSKRPCLENDKLLQNRSNTENNLRKRSNSVTGVFIDAPTPDGNVRRNSIEGITIRPLSAAPADLDENQNIKAQQKSRPSTSAGGVEREKSKVSFKSNTSPRPNTNTNGNSASHAPFSSHEAVEREITVLTSSRSARDTKPSFVTADDSIESNLGTDLFEERRVELLQEENLFYSNLEKRKNEFIGKVDSYLASNPPAKFDVPFIPIGLHNDDVGNDDEDVVMSHSRRRGRMTRQYDFNRTFTSEEEYNERGQALWKDMNKTRYLRVPDEKLDLTGVVTLAKDQMKLFKMLSSTEPAHIIIHS